MAVEEAIKHLKKATTDNEKIAALLLVSKVVRAGEVSREERRQIFNAIGFSFINRLLNTSSTTEEEATSDGSLAVNAYQRLAVTLLGCFTTDPQLATHAEVTSKIPLFLKFVSIRCLQSDVETVAMQEDCLQVLLSLTCSPAGLHLLLSSNCMLVIARLLVADGACRQSVRKLLEAMLSQSAVVTRHTEMVGEVVSILATEFRANQGELKFELCDILQSVLGAVGETVVQEEVLWLEDVAAGLHDILCSKISSAMRASALLLSAQLCQSCGVEWTLTSGNNKLFRLMANLAAIEIQLCIEGQQLEAVVPQSQLLCGCCAILETSLVFAATQTQIDSSQRVLTEEDVLQLHSAFSEAFKSITEFLNSLSPHLPPHTPLILATVRVLGAGLAEEALTLTSELYQLLPNLLEMCRAHLQEGQATIEKRCLENPLKFLLPGLSHLMAEHTPRSIVKTHLPPLLLQYMKALYSSGSIHTMSPEAVSSFTLSLEVLLTVCVCEKELRKEEVFAELARLLSRLLVSGGPDMRLALQAALLWLLVAHEQEESTPDAIGQQCCEVVWSDLWHRIAEVLLATLQLMIPPGHTQLTTSLTASSDQLAELWHLTMREVTSFAVSATDVCQLLVDSSSISNLFHHTTTYAGEHEQELAAIRRLMEALH